MTMTEHLLKCLASTHVIRETSERSFAANNTTKALASPAGAIGLGHRYVIMELPSSSFYSVFRF